MRSLALPCFVTLCFAAQCLAQSGVVKSEGQPIPGVTVKATQGDRILTTLTDGNGAFQFDGMAPGLWNVEATMFGFDVSRREVQVAATPTKIDFTLQLRDPSRSPQRGQFGGDRGAGAQGGNRPAAGLGDAAADLNAPGGDGTPPANDAGAPNDNAQGNVQNNNGVAVPEAGAAPQVGVEGSNESFLVNGSLSRGLQTQSGDFAPDLPLGPGGLGGPGGPGGLAGRPGGPGGPGGGPGGGLAGGGGGFGGGGGGGFGGGGGGGFGGRGGGAGGRGPGGRGPGRQNANGGFIGNRARRGQNQVRGQVFYTFANSALNAEPFSLTGAEAPKAAYSQNRFGFNIGGPLVIPKLVNWDKTFFFINYTGNLLRNPFDATTTVPTLAERGGDFSGIGSILYYPSSNTPIPGNQLTQLDPVALGLLKYIPLPNQPGVQNYRFIASQPNNSQSLNTRINQAVTKKDNLSLAFNLQERNSENYQPYGFLDSSNGQGINVNLNWRHNLGPRAFQNFQILFNRNTNNSVPFFANGSDVASLLGIQGTSTNPLNFGPPNVSFTNFGAISDGSPSTSAIYSYGFNDSVSLHFGKHNWSFGAGYTRYFNNTTTDANGRGTFTFTGLSTSGLDASGLPLPNTGFDFADFLLGLPQSNSIRYGSSNTSFVTNSYNAFAQDDWRLTQNFSLNLGLRYEYFAPWQERYGRIANLDIAPGFTAVAPVVAGAAGPYSGIFPSGLINPDRNNFAPRTALAWKPWPKGKLVVRAGYGIYYNPGVYNQFMSRLSAQPPFATSTTVNTSLDNILTLANGLTVTPDGKTILNTFAVDRNYRDAYAQTWNVSVQRDLPGALVMEVSYLGTKGTRLDIQRDPNRAPPGSPLTAEQRLLIGNATGFTYDTSDGNSIYHAGQVRLTRRFRSGISTNILYTYAKSIDDSSTFGGAGNTVAQNDQDISAERGLSSFDRRHVLTANYVLASPVGGRTGLLSSHPFAEKALKDWTLSGSITAETGTPLTARVLGNQSDTGGTGSIGSGRGDATGLPLTTSSGLFNPLAFALPLPGTYGDAGRNTIPGPGMFTMNLSLGRNIDLGERKRLEFRIDSTNFLNHVNISNYGTVLNAVNYGLPTSAAGMRSLTATLRFRF